MRRDNGRFLRWIVTTCTIVPFFFTCPASASSDFPNKPIQLIVAYPPGGGSDIGSRIIAERLGEFLGQPVVIVNKPGAGGVIGITAAAKSLTSLIPSTLWAYICAMHSETLS